MKKAFGLAVTVGLAGCGKPAPQQPSSGPLIAAVAELGLLMKNDINPAFSRLSFLMFHGDSVEADPAVLDLELAQHAASLRAAIARLRAWTRVPARSDEGRQVFLTYAESVDRSTDRLVQAIARGERSSAAAQLEQIADTCNSCHHFFRLQIEDSVVPRRTAKLEPDLLMSTVK